MNAPATPHAVRQLALGSRSARGRGHAAGNLHTLLPSQAPVPGHMTRTGGVWRARVLAKERPLASPLLSEGLRTFHPWTCCIASGGVAALHSS